MVHTTGQGAQDLPAAPVPLVAAEEAEVFGPADAVLADVQAAVSADALAEAVSAAEADAPAEVLADGANSLIKNE